MWEEWIFPDWPGLKLGIWLSFQMPFTLCPTRQLPCSLRSTPGFSCSRSPITWECIPFSCGRPALLLGWCRGGTGSPQASSNIRCLPVVWLSPETRPCWAASRWGHTSSRLAGNPPTSAWLIHNHQCHLLFFLWPCNTAFCSPLTPRQSYQMINRG